MTRNGLPLHHSRPLGRRLLALGSASAPLKPSPAAAPVHGGKADPGARQPAVLPEAGKQQLLPEAMPSRPDGSGAPIRPKMTKPQARVFGVLAPAALAIVATDGPVSVVLHGRNGAPDTRLGHNRGIWPARVVKTAGWRDPAGAWDKSPLIPLATQIELWAPTVVERDRVAAAVLDLMAEREEQWGGLLLGASDAHSASAQGRLAHEFRDLGPELDLTLFAGEIRDIGRRTGSRALWSDGELVAFLDLVWARAVEAAGHMPATDRTIEHIIAREIGK